jgi:carbamoyl-phosphate synthase small subunit
VSRAPALLVLEDGRAFCGESYGAAGETVGEAVFSTAMTGYQETLTDPSYHGQIVVVDPRVADVRSGLDDDLPVVRRVREGFLVAGHRGREHRFADRLPRGAVGLAAEGPAVLEYEQRGSAAQAGFPSKTVGRPRRKVATTRPGSDRPS